MGEVTQIKPAVEDSAAKARREPRPTQVVPTERIQFKRQLDILRAFAAASGPTNTSVTNKQVAEILKMASSTVSLANPFFTETGLLVKEGSGFMPSSEVMDYNRAFAWNPDTAAHKLGSRLREAWFVQAVTPKLTFSQMSETEAINTLADASAAAPKFRPNLKLLIDYMEAAGMIERDGDVVRLARSAPAGQPEPAKSEKPVAPTKPAAAVATAFTQPTEGVVQFHVSVKVDMGEFATWRPERISAFFAGIAQVLSAKAAVEQSAGGD